MKIQEITEKHQYPKYLMRYPQWIFVHYNILKVLFLRSRVCYRNLNKLLKKKIIEDGPILDAGCGEGQYLIPLALNFRNREFTGIDVNLSHLRFLRKLIRSKQITNCSLQQKSIASYCNTGAPYSLIYLIGVLQYTNPPAETIRSCARLLKPSGYLMIYTPVKTTLNFSFYTWIRKKYGHYDDAQSVYQPIDEAYLNQWIQAADFHIIQKEYHYGYAGTLGHEILQSVIILITHWPSIFKIIPLLLFIILIPIFVSLQIVDDLIPPRFQKRGNGLLLILQKQSVRGQKKEEDPIDDSIQSN